MMNDYDRLLEKARLFRDLLSENRSCGSADSEVYYTFKELLRQAAKGQDPYVPMSFDGWKLYNMPGSHVVAKQLHTAAVATINAIKNCPIRYIQQVNDFVREL
jgi:hypothetical protein